FVVASAILDQRFHFASAAPVLGRQTDRPELYRIERAVDRWRRTRARACLGAQANPAPLFSLLRPWQCRDRRGRGARIARYWRSRRGRQLLPGVEDWPRDHR